MRLGRIPRSKMMDYAHECGMGINETYEFVSILRQVDDAYVDEQNKRSNGE